MVRNLTTILCGILGGVIGYAGFVWLLGQGYYALVLPGGLLGLAAGIVPSRWRWVPIICAILAIGAGLIAEHRAFPFVADPSLGYFLRHLGDLRPVTMMLIGLGGFIGFWVPFRRRC